jgi:hypothetical protein
MQCQKKEKKVRRQWYGLTCTSDNKTDERCHHRRNRRKKMLKIKLELIIL